MTYFLAATLALVLFVLAGWRSQQNRARAARADADVLADGFLSATATNRMQADVATSVGLALKRLLPVLADRGVRADVAVRQGIQVRMPGTSLADLLEELLGTAIHQSHATRLLVTAINHGNQVSISVTDDVSSADPTMRAGEVRSLAERVALRGGALETEMRPGEGTTMTLRLAAVTNQTVDPVEAESSKAQGEADQLPALRTAAAMPVVGTDAPL